MNVSAPKTQENTTKVETSKSDSAVKKTEDTKAADAAKETAAQKDEAEKKESDFKKLLDKNKETEKTQKEQNTQEQQLISQEQNPNNVNNPGGLNQNYINQFGFDIASSLGKQSLSMNFDTAKISKDDAKFFADLVDNKQFVVQENGAKTSLVKFADEIGPTYKTQQSSKTLMNLVEKAYKTGQSVRIEFDNNVSVIMKIDKKGKISAEFIPGDKAVEEYLRNNIRSLKQRFEDESIGYNDIFYRQSRQQNQQKRKNKGE